MNPCPGCRSNAPTLKYATPAVRLEQHLIGSIYAYQWATAAEVERGLWRCIECTRLGYKRDKRRREALAQLRERGALVCSTDAREARRG